mmetsp:Transcript_15792/g.38441  ORF Transcript_15792/g.38441 Transcript_15792/m.38441 type:complete len:266 (+) Transcript_15792:265-1062(+)
MKATSFSVGAASSRVRSPACVPSCGARAVAPARASGIVSAAAVKTQQRQHASLNALGGLTQRSSSMASYGRSALAAPSAAVSRSARRGAPVTTTTARYSTNSYGGGGGGGIVPIPDRVVGLLPYIMPLLDGLRYSRFFFQQFPQTIFLMAPLQPIASMYFSIPFASMICFFAIYLGVAENRSLSRFVRFNAAQAIILDICLVLPGMVEYVLDPGMMSGLMLTGYKMCYNAIWLFVVGAFVLAALSCITGNTFKLPFIGDAAEARV